MTPIPMMGLYFDLTGRWKTNAGAVLGLLAIVLFGSFIQYRASSAAAVREVAGTWTAILLVLQCIALLLFGPSSVRKAVARDFQTGMMESIRLTPIPSLGIAVGYLLGPMMTALFVAAGAALAGAAMSGLLAYDMNAPWMVTTWYLGQIGLLIMSLLYGSFVLMTTLAVGGKGNPLGLMFLVGFAGAAVIQHVPGLMLLSGMYSVTSVMSALTPRATLAPLSVAEQMGMLASPMLQIIFAGLFIVAGARKIRSPDRPLFDVRLGLILMTLTAAALLLGVMVRPTSSLFGNWTSSAPTVIVSTCVFILVAQVPLLAAAAASLRLRISAQYGDVSATAARSQGALLDAMPVLVGLSVLLVLWLLTQSGTGNTTPFEQMLSIGGSGQRATAAFVAVLLSIFADYQFYRLVLATGRKVLGMFILWCVVVKLVPLVFEAIVLTAGDFDDNFGAAGISGASPFGSLGLMFSPAGSPWVGVVAQLILAAAMFSWANRATAKALETAARNAADVIPARPLGAPPA
ncbi:MAG: hypothetical protein IPM64_15525 [Phycisphaerales bacterium]|nr:hypothetical protein [Phycisphaerales bacterium]